MTKKRTAFLEELIAGGPTPGSRLALLKSRLQSKLEALHASHGHPHPEAGGPCEHELVVASYNIHKCVGTDGVFAPGRIAAVMAELNADVVAIQEADERFGRRRGLLDIKALEKATGLVHVPTAAAVDGHGWHGNALFLRHGSVKAMQRLSLPGAEPRGALIVDLELPGGPLRLVAAHLGLLRRSRLWQVRFIVEAIGHGPRVPTLLCGDFNEWRPGPRSALHGLKPVFGSLPSGLLSFPSYFPVAALDRMIGSPGLVTALEVHNSPLSQVASDHLPLKARIDVAAAVRALRAEAA